jgi:hypothetical protein
MDDASIGKLVPTPIALAVVMQHKPNRTRVVMTKHCGCRIIYLDSKGSTTACNELLQQ